MLWLYTWLTDPSRHHPILSPESPDGSRRLPKMVAQLTAEGETGPRYPRLVPIRALGYADSTIGGDAKISGPTLTYVQTSIVVGVSRRLANSQQSLLQNC